VRGDGAHRGHDARARNLLAITAVVGLTLVNLRGITRTARLSRVLVSVTVGSLAVVIVVVLLANRTWRSPVAAIETASPYGILQSAGLLFFAFAGYARIATLGEEVRDPATTIPRAVTRALGLVVALYAVVAVVLLVTIGAAGVAGSPLPLLAAAEQAGVPWLGVVLRLGAVVASLGALLGLIAGVGRTSLAMAREGDLPRLLARVEVVHQVPRSAEIVVCAVVILLIVLTDLQHAIGFSSFGVLVYYAIANAAAVSQAAEHRRWPRSLHVVGLVACLVLVVTLPWTAVLAGAVVLAVGVLARRAALSVRSRVT
jgi:APA family basic amino acid/polyamine antiporter